MNTFRRLKIVLSCFFYFFLLCIGALNSQTKVTEIKYQVNDKKVSLVDSIFFIYNSNDQLNEVRFSNAEPVSSKSYLYNASGKLAEEKHYRYTNLKNTYKFEYNKAGRLTKEKCYDSKDKLLFTNTLKYDSKGNMIRKKSNISTGIKIENTYDSKNNNFKSVISGNSRNQKEIEYVYDDNGKVTQEIIYQSLKNSKSGKRYQQSKLTFKYDDYGKLTEKLNYLTNEVIEKFIYTYDNNGKLSKWEKFNPQGKLEYYVEYKYE